MPISMRYQKSEGASSLTNRAESQLVSDHVQSNQKMHDLYATKHISEMVFPDAFLGSIESNFFLIS